MIRHYREMFDLRGRTRRGCLNVFGSFVFRPRVVLNLNVAPPPPRHGLYGGPFRVERFADRSVRRDEVRTNRCAVEKSF